MCLLHLENDEKISYDLAEYAKDSYLFRGLIIEECVRVRLALAHDRAHISQNNTRKSTTNHSDWCDFLRCKGIFDHAKLPVIKRNQ